MSRILVIDDYPSVRQVLEYYLPLFGHSVISAPDGVSGLRLAAQGSVDMILLDLDMPRMTGLTVCQALKRDPQLAHLPVILMTGRLTSEVTARAQAAGVALVVGKPFEWNELVSAIARGGASSTLS